MLELNCTYEESKKILELGYDFSKVCIEFGNGNPTYVKVNDDLYLPTYSERWGGIVHAGAFEGELPKGEIPLIPKAALEACLPHSSLFSIDSEEHHMDWVVYLESRYIGLRFWASKCKDGHITWHTPEERFRFNSIFEAFLWLHENYPNELKAKFDEVMG